MEEKQIKKPPKTYRANSKSIRRAKTARVGRRGLQELDEIFKGLSGFGANTIGLTEHITTYGEVANAGIPVLVDIYKRYAPLSGVTPANRNFFDLGCGVGRLVVGIALLAPEIRSHGIEIVSDRVKEGQTALTRIHSKNLSSRIQIRQGSFLDAAVSYNSSCWIFLSNLCLTQDIHRSLAERLEKECSPGCIIICSRELPLSTDRTVFEKLESYVVVPMTWSATSTCFVYRRMK